VNINATLLGQFIFVFAMILTFAGYYFGKRKTQTPKMMAAIGFVSAFVPPLGVIFLMVMAFKKDLPKELIESS